MVYGPAFELQHERRDPLVVLAELVLARERVVHPVDPLRRQRGVVEVGRADEVPSAARFMEIVVEIGAGRDQAVDVAALDEVRDQQPHAAGRQRAGGAEKNRRVAREHLFPDAPRRREVAPLERDAFHPLEHRVGRQSGFGDERFDRLAKEA